MSRKLLAPSAPPALTTTQRDALSAIVGDQVWNTTTARLEVYNGSSWTPVFTVTQSSLPMTDPIISSKLLTAGHSYGQAPQSVVDAGFAGGFSLQSGSFHDRGMWPSLLQDVLGIGSDRKFYIITIPPLGAAVDGVFPLLIEEDSVIMGAAYIPGGAITSGATNYRKWTIEVPANQFAAPSTPVAYADSQAGLSASTEVILCKLNNVAPPFTGNNSNAYMSAAGTYTASAPVCGGGQIINIKSTHVSLGKAEPGGTFVVCMGGRFRNMCVSGSQLQLSGVYQGGWATSMNPRWALRGALPHYQALPVNLGADFFSTQTTVGGTISTVGSTVTVASTVGKAASGTFSFWTNSGAVTVTYTGTTSTTFTGCTIASGSFAYASGAQCCDTTVNVNGGLGAQALGGTITMFNGTAVTLTVIAGAGATTLTVAATSGGNHGTTPASTQGHFIAAGQNPDNITATQTAALLTGVNDAMGAFDIVAIRECLRAWAAFQACGAFYESGLAFNLSSVGGSGSVRNIAVAAGQWGGSFLPMGGAITPTPPVTTIYLGPAFDGSIIDLFFLCWAGSNRGGTASIKIDGADPSQGAVTVCTNNAAPVCGTTSITGTVANTSTTFTRTDAINFTINDIGKMIVGTNIPKGAYISAVPVGGALTCTMSSAATGANTGTYTIVGMVPMVKRIANVPAGAHTITVTLTSIAATDGSAEVCFAGWGFEPDEVSDFPAPIMLGKAPQCPGVSAGTNTNIVSFNAAIDQVIAGTAAALSGNSSESSLGSGAVAVDLDTLLNKNVKYFASDGLHPNSQGQAIMAQAFETMLRRSYTQAQSIAR